MLSILQAMSVYKEGLFHAFNSQLHIQAVCVCVLDTCSHYLSLSKARRVCGPVGKMPCFYHVFI